MTREPPAGGRRHAALIAALCTSAVAALFVPLWRSNPTLVVWNASASAPIGLYTVTSSARLRTGDFVATDLPASPRVLAAHRGYLPADVLLIKPVSALPGTEVCRHGTQIYVNGIRTADAQTVDKRGRAMPTWQGCRIIATGDIFLMNARIPDSFDGRYFGPIPRNLVLGRAVPLLTFVPASYSRQAPSH